VGNAKVAESRATVDNVKCAWTSPSLEDLGKENKNVNFESVTYSREESPLIPDI